MRACFDATVLCGALRNPMGVNFRLLALAAEGTVLQGFTTEVVGFEFVRNALEGLGGIAFTPVEIDAFLDAFGPLFAPLNVAASPIGRALSDRTWLHNRAIGEVVYELTGRTREDLLRDLPEQLRVVAGEFDPYDVHLVAGAVAGGADVICSANRRHLPEGRLAGDLYVVGPGRLASEFGVR